MTKKLILICLFLLTVILSKEVLLIDEEFILIIAFSLFIFALYKVLNQVLADALDERIEQIRQIFVGIIQVKRANLIANREILLRISSTSDELLDFLAFIRATLFNIEAQWNFRLEFLLNYIAKTHLNLIIHEELDLLYSVYFKSIAHLFYEIPFWFENSALVDHKVIENLGLDSAFININTELLINKLFSLGNANAQLLDHSILNSVLVISNTLHLSKNSLVYLILVHYINSINEGE